MGYLMTHPKDADGRVMVQLYGCERLQKTRCLRIDPGRLEHCHKKKILGEDLPASRSCGDLSAIPAAAPLSVLSVTTRDVYPNMPESFLPSLPRSSNSAAAGEVFKQSPGGRGFRRRPDGGFFPV